MILVVFDFESKLKLFFHYFYFTVSKRKNVIEFYKQKDFKSILKVIAGPNRDVERHFSKHNRKKSFILFQKCNHNDRQNRIWNHFKVVSKTSDPALSTETK